MASSSKQSIDLRTICDLLGEVGHKWFKIGIQLGIPHSKLQEFKKEDDPLAAAIDFWLRGNVPESVSPISWESIARALNSKYVGEPGLANETRIKCCQQEDDDTGKDADNVPSASKTTTDVMDPDVKMDLEFILEKNLKQIIKKYASYVDSLCAAVREKGVSPEDLRLHLMSLSATSKTCKAQMLNLLADKKQELEKCSTIAAIFTFLTTECASFLNYDIFQSIQEHYSIYSDQGILKEYTEHLKTYINKHKISEFSKINPLLKKRKGSKKFTLKYDISMTTRLARVCELKKLIADVMDLNPSALEIVDLEEGCVIVTFLIPSTVADALFTPDTVFTPQQEQRLHDNSVIWMRCNGHMFNFEKQQQQQALQKLKEQLTCSICLAIYIDPKQLQCQHAYCHQCLMGLVQQDQQGQPTLTCPTCRQVTPVPASGVAGLQADFRANQLLDVMDDNNWMVGATTHCKKEIMNSPFSKATVSCLEHDGKDLELFCETCDETICLKCAVKGGKHHSHDYMDLNEALDKCKSKIESSLVTIEKALADLKAHRDLISDQRAAIEEEIHSTQKNGYQEDRNH